MISNILAGIFEPRTVRKYVGRHRAGGSGPGPVPRPRAALEARAPERTARTATAAFTDVTMELTPVPARVRPAAPPPG